MDRYDENLFENKFLNCLKSQYDEVFEEAVSSNCIICVPKSDIVEKTTINIILDHILDSASVEDNGQGFTSKLGNKLILKEGCFISKMQDKYVNVLFEETFYDSKLGKYKVVCIDNYITNLFTEGNFSLNEVTDGSLRNRRPSRILRNLRSVNDFSDYIYKSTQSHSSIDKIDTYIAEFLSIPLSTFDHPKTEDLRNKVQEIFDKSVKNIIGPLDENEANILRISVESYIIHNVYKILFEASTFDMAQNDEKLNRMLHNIKDFNISNFDKKINNLNWLLSAKYELAAVNSYKSPFGKLQCVKRSIECFETENILSSDELLPILVFCIIKCNLSNWFANLSFIKIFHFCMKMNEEYGFILSSLEAALHYLLSGEVNKIASRDFKSELLNNCNLPIVESSVGNAHPWLQKGRNGMLSSLHDKIKEDNIETVKGLLETEGSSETFSSFLGQESQLCHPLCTCAKCKGLLHESCVQLLPCDINSADDSKMTLLHVAAMHGSIKVVEYLLAKGASFESRNLTGMMPLHLAAYKGQQSALLLLLHSGCDISSVDNEGNTALHLACIAGHDNCVKALIFFAESVGFPIGLDRQNLCGDTPLHLASRWGYSSTVKLLLSQPHVVISCLDIKNKRNQTPVDCAHNTAISFLLKESAISAENLNDLSIFVLNFERQNLEKERVSDTESNLNGSESSAKVQETFCSSENGIILEKILKAIKIGDVKLACFYLEINDDIPYPACNQSYSSSPCHPLCQCSDCSALPQVVAVRSNSSLINMVGKNHGVLHAAICAGDLELCRTLLCSGANPLIMTQVERQSCLHLAITTEHYEIMKLLIEFGANVNVIDVFGNTPLHWACIRGWKQGVILLIDSGAKMDKNNKNELTPKEEAYRNGHMEIVGFLVRKINES